MYHLRLLCFVFLLSCVLSSCAKHAFHFVSPDYQPDKKNQVTLLSPYLYQGIIRSGNKVELKDSLNYAIATILDEQLPKHLAGAENIQPITVSPKTRRDLGTYLYRVRLDSEYNRRKTRRVKIPQQICEELQQEGAQFVTVFVSDGHARTTNNYSNMAAASRAANATLALTTLAFTPYQVGKVGKIGAKNASIQPYSSSLELFVLDVQKQEVLKYQRSMLYLPPTNPFTIRQHLTSLFLE